MSPLIRSLTRFRRSHRLLMFPLALEHITLTLNLWFCQFLKP